MLFAIKRPRQREGGAWNFKIKNKIKNKITKLKNKMINILNTIAL